MAGVGRPGVAPELHGQLALLLYLLDLLVLEVAAPVERGGLRVAKGAGQAANVSLGVGVEEALHVLVEVQPVELEEPLGVAVGIDREVLVPEHSADIEKVGSSVWIARLLLGHFVYFIHSIRPLKG